MKQALHLPRVVASRNAVTGTAADAQPRSCIPNTAHHLWPPPRAMAALHILGSQPKPHQQVTCEQRAHCQFQMLMITY